MSQLILENLSYSYDQHHPVLKNITLQFDHEKTAIIGQNGAGKTTLVKLLKKLLLPTEGQIKYRQRDYREMTTAQLAKDIGLAFQNPNDQIFKNTVFNEVMFGPLNIGFSKEEAIETTKKALEAVKLSNKGDKNPYDLSLAERKLVSIASVLAMDTEVVIFDEPTMGQDNEGKQIIKELITQLALQNKLVLCILHDMDFTAEVFERVIVLNEGELLMDGSPLEVFSRKDIIEKAHLEQPMVYRIAQQIRLTGNILKKQDLIQTMKKLM